MLTAIADSAIPGVKELFSPFAEVKTIAGNKIQPNDLKQADILLIRTVTKVNSHLLADSPVKFVGTMTAGTDHLDTQWLEQQKISWTGAAGANAKAVVQYVIATIAHLQQQNVLPPKSLIGIVGVGHVGSILAKMLEVIGIDFILNDPPRALQDSNFISTPLNKFKNVDLITLHVPFIKSGAHSTLNLISEDFSFKEKSILINTSRGEAVDPKVFKKDIITCLDVWKNEPHIDLEIFQHSLISTPHIAGYSLPAKLRATIMVFKAAAKFFQWKIGDEGETLLANASPQKILNLPNAQTWQEVVLNAYNIEQESLNYKKDLLQHRDKVAERYEYLRRNYPLRPEFETFVIQASQLHEKDKGVLRGLGFNFLLGGHKG